jgi:hypothetical protein
MGGRSSVGPRSWAPWMGERRDIAPWLRARGAGSSPGPTAMEDVGARRRGARLEVAERCSACCCREGEGEWRGGEEGGRGQGAAIYRAKLWTCHTTLAGGRCKSVDIGWPFLAFFCLELDQGYCGKYLP